MVAQDLYDAIKKKEKPSKGKTDFNEDYDDGANEEDGWGEVFDDECFEKLRRQYFINTASTSVAACKGALLNIKATSVTDAVKRLRTTNESKDGHVTRANWGFFSQEFDYTHLTNDRQG
ncbi:WSSV262 [White spot syndrome virus]|uniref:WSSV262 n=1 Tax=White spot syndrome virus TaxID=342409 RepID=A0A2I6SBY5_9VIRU|nr:WSSV262 [White spot syndrome virus]